MTQLEQKFIRAIAFCLRCDGHSGDLEAWAKWALRLSDAEPEDPQKEVVLVAGGATKIKGYVFESARLPEIRGASGLLDRINLEDMRRLWRDDLGCEDCIIYNNGGEVLAFAPLSKAAWLADAIEQIYTRETLVAQSVAVWGKFTLKQLREGLNADEPLTDAQAETVRHLLGCHPADNKTFGSLVAPLALARCWDGGTRRRPRGTPTNRFTSSIRLFLARRRWDGCCARCCFSAPRFFSRPPSRPCG